MFFCFWPLHHRCAGSGKTTAFGSTTTSASFLMAGARSAQSSLAAAATSPSMPAGQCMQTNRSASKNGLTYTAKAASTQSEPVPLRESGKCSPCSRSRRQHLTPFTFRLTPGTILWLAPHNGASQSRVSSSGHWPRSKTPAYAWLGSLTTSSMPLGAMRPGRVQYTACKPTMVML